VYSFTTTTGQGKGSAGSPGAAAWRLPYHDDFDGYPNDATPKYVSDLGGTFATAPCRGRDGRCLRALVDQQPVRWNNTANHPLSIVGDPADWHDYQVSVDAMLEQAGSLDLGGRVTNGTSGYHLKLTSDGNWTLAKVTPTGNATTLASGATPRRRRPLAHPLAHPAHARGDRLDRRANPGHRQRQHLRHRPGSPASPPGRTPNSTTSPSLPRRARPRSCHSTTSTPRRSSCPGRASRAPSARRPPTPGPSRRPTSRSRCSHPPAGPPRPP
jgi:hypothetical protein